MLITQEHFDWWAHLPILWKRILLVSLHRPEIAQSQIDCDLLEYSCDFVMDYADKTFFLNYPIPNQITEDELTRLFQVRVIAYNGDEPFPPEGTYIDRVIPLHYFEKLEYLSLANNYIEDLSGLSGIKTLRYLNLFENSLSDNKQLNFISTLENLEWLELGFNAFDSDISPLMRLGKLKYLSLMCGKHIAFDLTGIENLQKLEALDILLAQDLTPVAKLTHLREFTYGTDECDFDCSQLGWIMEQLPDCKMDYTFPFKQMSDDTFLWKVILTEGSCFFRHFDVNRFIHLIENYQNSDNAYKQSLAEKAMDTYLHKWNQNLPY